MHSVIWETSGEIIWFQSHSVYIIYIMQNPTLRRLWLFCEEPDSSLAARIFAILSIICIMTSITSFCMETIPKFDRPPCINSTVEPFHLVHDRDAFFYIESVCVTWFTIEFMLRLISCPSKMEFIRDIMNAIDVLAIVPFFVTLTMQVGRGRRNKSLQFKTSRTFWP